MMLEDGLSGHACSGALGRSEKTPYWRSCSVIRVAALRDASLTIARLSRAVSFKTNSINQAVEWWRMPHIAEHKFDEIGPRMSITTLG